MQEVGSLVVGGVAVFVGILAFWRNVPLRWQGWWAYYTDVVYHEALATSVSTWGPQDNIFLAGEPVRYHWLVHAWAGMTTHATDAAPFVVTTRLIPLVATVGLLTLAWTWARRLSTRSNVPILAVGLTALAMDVGYVGETLTYPLSPYSPTAGFSGMWLIAASLVITEHVAGRLRHPEFILGLLAFGCVGGRVSNAAVLLVALTFMAIAVSRNRDVLSLVLRDLAAVVLGTGMGYTLLLFGAKGGAAANALSLGLGGSARAFNYIVPPDSWPQILAGSVAVALSILAKWAGIGVLVATSTTRQRPEVWYFVGAGLAGIIAVIVLTHDGYSQLAFPMSASVLVVVASAWGLGEGLALLPEPKRFRLLSLAAVLAGALAIASSVVHHVGPELQRPWAVAAPVLVWAPILTLALVCRYSRVMGPVSGRFGISILTIWALCVASVAAGVVTSIYALRTSPSYRAAPTAPNAWTQQHVAANTWLRTHTPQEDIVATNRLCSDARESPPNCDARWFFTAAEGRRRMFIEGYGYAIGRRGLPQWAIERIVVSRRFANEPSEADSRTLIKAGVRWVYVDHASTTTRSWAPWGSTAFSNDVASIVRLTSADTRN